MQWKFCTRLTLTICLAFGALSCRETAADDKPPEDLSGWQRLFREHAAGYRFVVDGRTEAEVKLVPKPDPPR